MNHFYGTHDEAEFLNRVKFLEESRADLFDSRVFDPQIFNTRRSLATVVSGYFLLNRNYREWRIRSGARTTKPKVAGLMALSILTFSPITPIVPLPIVDGNPLSRMRHLLANEIFALYVCSNIVPFPLLLRDAKEINFWIRIAEQFRFTRLGFTGLDSYKQDIALESVKYTEDFSAYRHDYHSSEHQKTLEYITVSLNLIESIMRDFSYDPKK